MLNHIVLMGRLTRDPELRSTQSGTPVASFTLAVDRDYAPKDGGERQTDFIDVVAWRQTGEFVSKYFQKGSMAVVTGRLQLRDWQDKEGNRRRSAEVIAESVYFAESKTASKLGQEPNASGSCPKEERPRVADSATGRERRSISGAAPPSDKNHWRWVLVRVWRRFCFPQNIRFRR